MKEALTLDEYSKSIKDVVCRWCGTILPTENIEYYDHDGGWPVKEFDRPQWLYIKCPKCKYDWALWKLGVPR